MPVSQRLVAALLLVSLSTLSLSAQQTKRNPEQQPRRVKQELKKAYVEWINEVDIILTQSERDAWKKLATDNEREKFIEDVWHSRDPDPDTLENEFKEQFFERVAYANEHFSSGKPGRFTDRGRIYIKFGKPDEIESHPAGGIYERPSWEGGGSTSTYPFEKWFYRHIPNVRSGVELEFVDPTGSGEYRLARNPDEKDALIQVPGAGPTFAELAGLAQRSDRIAGLGSFGRVNYSRSQDSPFEVMDLLASLERDQPFERDFIGSRIPTPIVDDNAISFETQLNYFKQSDNRVLTVLTVQTNNDELAFTNNGGLETAHLNIFGWVTSVANRRVGKFEDSVTTTATADELSATRTRKSAYARGFILEPGRYKVDVIVRDTKSGAAGLRQVGIVVPEFPADRLSSSSIVLAAKLENVESGDAVTPFVIGTTKVIPNLSGVFRRNQPVGVYLQIYNAAIDQTTLRPAADAEYVLLKNGKEIGKQTEDWRQINDAGQRLTLSRLIDSRTLEPGEYQIRINIRDQVSGETISPSATFTIVP
ncbi:MAG TPA: GWxTD domain-containing protein [Pyrinomonadaceae bacterium]|jgi:GWxTD domain-containing protein|nr:GWxTD domain-containing protein [Pyrinomonadaceae bacterium]